MDKRSTADKVLQALEALKRGGKTITVSGVAKKAGLERKTIYNHPELLLRVKQVAETRNAANQGSEPNWDRGKSPEEERIARYRDDIRRLEEEKAKLLYQNTLLTEKLLAVQRRLFELEEAMRSRPTEPLVAVPSPPKSSQKNS